MPPVAIAAAFAAVAAASSVVIAGVTVASAVGTFLVTTALAGASYLLQADGAQSSSGATQPTAAPANAFRTIPARQPVPPRRFILGDVRTAGVYFFLDTDNPELYIGVLLSDGEIEGVTQLYVGDTAVGVDGSGDALSGSIYTGHLTVEYATGAASQAASPLLLAAFDSIDSDFTQTDIARAVLCLDWGEDATDHQALWGAGITATFQTQGVLAYDPREVAHDVDDPTTWEYTDNPALLIAFVLMQAWDVGIDDADIDFVSIEDAADDFDATLSYGGETVALMELAGVFQSGHDLATQLDDMCRSCGAALTYSEGKYGLVVDKARSTVWTIEDADVVALGPYSATGTVDQTPTAIKARYFDRGQGGLQTTTPIYQDTAAVTAEGFREAVIPLGYTPTSYQAQILAYRELQKARDGRQLSITVSDAGLYLVPMDRVTIDLDNASFLNGEYTVTQVDLGENGCILALRAYVAGAYDTPSTYLV